MAWVTYVQVVTQNFGTPDSETGLEIIHILRGFGSIISCSSFGGDKNRIEKSRLHFMKIIDLEFELKTTGVTYIQVITHKRDLMKKVIKSRVYPIRVLERKQKLERKTGVGKQNTKVLFAKAIISHGNYWYVG